MTGAVDTPFAATVLTLFPAMFPGPLGVSIAGRALKAGIWSLATLDIRDFARDKHRSVDDTPFGGGAGMVLKPDVVAAALDAADAGDGDPGGTRRIYLSPRGRPLDQALVRELAATPRLILLCGRYEGVDQRVLDARAVEEVSLGDFVLSGGEVAAMALLEAVVRLLPGAMGNKASRGGVAEAAVVDTPGRTESSLTELGTESFTDGLLEHPHYTRPAEWADRDGVVRSVPAVLTGGDHRAVGRWRHERSVALTKARRPDLWARYIARPGSTEAE